MSLSRRIDGSEPLRPEPVGRVDKVREIREDTRTTHVADATLACPRCDAPVALFDGPATPADALACPVCAHAGAVRDFLSFTQPTRPAHVEVRIRDGRARLSSAR